MAETAAQKRTKKAEAPVETAIVAFKGFDKNLQCRGYQYEVGKTYEHTGRVEACSGGFHSCQDPMDVLSYYGIGDNNRFCQVTLGGAISRHYGDSKIASGRITIDAELRLPDFIKAAVVWMTRDIKAKVAAGTSDLIQSSARYSSKLAASGYSSQLAASGDSSQLAASGYSSKLAASGESSKLAASGYYSKLAASGDYSQLAASGNSSQLAASGDYSKLAASGDYSKLAASGYSSKLAASGYSSKLAASGYSSQLAASGDYSQLAASGYSSQLAASGESSKLAASGYYSKLAASGDYSQLAASGYSSQLAASGNSSQLAASGNSSQLAASGDYSVIASSAPGCTASGAIGTWISLAEFDSNYKCIGFAIGKIGDDGLLPDTFYRAEAFRPIAHVRSRARR